MSTQLEKIHGTSMQEGEQGFHVLSGHVALPASPRVCQPKTPCFQIMGASLHSQDPSLAPFSALFPSHKNGRARLRVLSASSWLGLSIDHPSPRSDPEATKSHLSRPKTLLPTRVFSWFQEPCVRNGGQRTNIGTKDAPSGNSKVLGLLYPKWGQYHTNSLISLILISANLSNSLWLMDTIMGSADFEP